MRIYSIRYLPCLLTVVSLTAYALNDGFDDEYDQKPWEEIKVQLPAFPKDGALIPFTVGAVRDKEFMIDGDSVSVGADGVVRYTIVIVSNSGAKNISFEGIRCATAERRYYAFGHSDGTWSKARSNSWIAIHGGSNDFHRELYSNYFCANSGVISVGDADEVRRTLRNGGLSAQRR